MSANGLLEMSYEEVIELFGNYFTKNPDITFTGKRFLITGLDKGRDEEFYSAEVHPVPLRVQALGGIVAFRAHANEISDLNYIVIGDCAPLRIIILAAAKKIDSGIPVQLIYLKDLEAALAKHDELHHQQSEEEPSSDDFILTPTETTFEQDSVRKCGPIIKGDAVSWTGEDIFKISPEEVIRLFENYFIQNPDITFEGKRFQFTGLDRSHNDGLGSPETHPTVQRVIAMGGSAECRITAKEPQDYLVIGEDAPSRGLLLLTAKTIDRGRAIQFIRLKDLEAVLDRRDELQRQQAEENTEERIRAQREREQAEHRAAEQKKQARREQLNAEKAELLKEMNSLRGLFAGIKRNKLQKRLDELNELLNKL